LALKNGGIAGETFNIGTGVATSINQLASILLEVTNKTHLKIGHSKPRKGDIRHSVEDISRARRKLGYGPKIWLKYGLERLLRQA
jgi:UDP-glucose 4-epimerase